MTPIDAVTAAVESEDAIEARISERFDILADLTNASIKGDARALIVSGPPGLGKSFTVERALTSWDPNETNHTIIKGYVKATGLYKTLYQYREEGQVIVFDDADAIFYDDVALNLLKACCDTTDRRRVSWRSEAKFIDEETAEIIPSSFDFNGTVIFITNLDMDGMVDRGHKIAAHLEALISRAHYIDLSLKTRRDYLIRIRQVIADGMLSNLDIEQKCDVLTFIEVHADNLRELSLRMAIKIANLRVSNPNWERLARVTCLR
jgi:hypothetical protein